MQYHQMQLDVLCTFVRTYYLSLNNVSKLKVLHFAVCRCIKRHIFIETHVNTHMLKNKIF